jgi:hypothetical protein
MIQHYVIKFVSDLRQVGGFLRVLRFPLPRYNWNIVESGVKHHNPSYINVPSYSVYDTHFIYQGDDFVDRYLYYTSRYEWYWEWWTGLWVKKKDICFVFNFLHSFLHISLKQQIVCTIVHIFCIPAVWECNWYFHPYFNITEIVL